MKFSHRFFLYAPVSVVVALAIAIGVYWNISANAFSKRLDALNGHEVAPGVHFQFASKSIGGFPFRVDAVLQKLQVSVASAHGPTTWKAEHFELHMLDYGSVHLVFGAAGKQSLSWHDKTGAAHGIEFVPALLRASAIAGSEGLKRFDVELIGAGDASISVAKSEFHIRRDPGKDAIDIVFMADDVHLPAPLSAALGNTITKIRLGGMLSPGASWAALFAGKMDWREATEIWRKHSGAFEIAKLEIGAGKVKAAGAGVLTLDGEHRPKGIVKLKIAGFQALAADAAKKADPNALLKGVMAEITAKAGAHAGTAPVTLAFKDGLAYADATPAGFLTPLY